MDRLLVVHTVADGDGGMTSDRIITMMKQERQDKYQCSDYLLENSILNPLKSEYDADKQHTPVDEECRRKMVIWCYKLVDALELSRSTVAVAISYLDRYLCTKKGQCDSLDDRRDFQLSTATTLYMAIKLCEPFVLNASLLAHLSRRLYTKEDILAKEQQILEALEWRLLKPMSCDFVNDLLVLPCETTLKDRREDLIDAIKEYAMYQTELSVIDYELSLVPPSIIAVASLLNAVDYIKDDLTNNIWEHYLHLFCHIEDYCSIHLLPDMCKSVQERLRSILLDAANTIKPMFSSISRRNISVDGSPSTQSKDSKNLTTQAKESPRGCGCSNNDKERTTTVSPTSCLSVGIQR